MYIEAMGLEPPLLHTSILIDFHTCFQEQIVYERWGLPVRIFF
jgi:hypothetical protein